MGEGGRKGRDAVGVCFGWLRGFFFIRVSNVPGDLAGAFSSSAISYN